MRSRPWPVRPVIFARLGPAKCEVLVDRFIVAIVKVFLQEMSRDLSADAVCNALRDTYNQRQRQYATYKVLTTDRNESLKDTLYWEFDKILLSFFDTSNPAILTHINILAPDIAKIMIEDAQQVE
jgi:hypothetical protein